MKILKQRGQRALGLAFATLMLTFSTSAFYNPNTGRWLSREPLGDPMTRAFAFDLMAAENSPPPEAEPDYVLGLNVPISRIDTLGLSSCDSQIDQAKRSKRNRKIIERMKKLGCSEPTLVGNDCCVLPDDRGNTECDKKQATVHICCKNIAKRDFELVVHHELVHALDCCRGKLR